MLHDPYQLSNYLQKIELLPTHHVTLKTKRVKMIFYLLCVIMFGVNWYHTDTRYEPLEYFQQLVAYGIVKPAMEESWFKLFYPYYGFGIVWCSVMFGLFHILNYRINKNKITTFIQCLVAGLLRYFVLHDTDLTAAIIYHGIFNIVCLTAVIIAGSYHLTKEEKEELAFARLINGQSMSN